MGLEATSLVTEHTASQAPEPLGSWAPGATSPVSVCSKPLTPAPARAAHPRFSPSYFGSHHPSQKHFLNTAAKCRVVRWMSGGESELQSLTKSAFKSPGCWHASAPARALALPASRAWPGLREAWRDAGPTVRAPTVAARPLALPAVTATSCLFREEA